MLPEVIIGTSCNWPLLNSFLSNNSNEIEYDFLAACFYVPYTFT